MNSTVPIEKHVVLVGAGNAHLVFLKRWRMSPWPGVAVTLVSESSEIPYSAMVPGHIAEQAAKDATAKPVVPLGTPWKELVVEHHGHLDEEEIDALQKVLQGGR